MGFVLGPAAERAGFRLKAFETIDSTNMEAMRLGRGGDRGPVWVVSTHQAAGRGRRGRSWSTPRGNLAASLLRVTALPPAQAATIGFVASLALERALRKVAPGANVVAGLDGGMADASNASTHHGFVQPSRKRVRFELKWPNDVLADGAKLAGILLESEAVADHARIVVVGIGVNVVSAPCDTPYPAASLADLGSSVDPKELFQMLSESWVEMESVWDEGRGIARLRELWLASAAGLGAPIAVQTGGALTRGVFETIDEAGQLVVRKPDGSRQTIAAGEVHFGAAATLVAGAA
jgi:BirA family biotin operon repressor/biotin-[acetyl-CoA-carboxylase] ligase